MNFCSREALARHGALPGTGVRGRAYVFVPVAKRWWGESEFNLGWASAAELAAVQVARKAGVVTRLYNPPETGASVLVHAEPEAPRPPALDPLLQLFSRRFDLDETPAPRLMVCTHGTRDRCCAKFGFAVWREARRLYDAGDSPFAPLECSHLGGDRFAATGIVFPSGSMYAHLDRVDLKALLAAEAAGRLLPEMYRGRVFEPQLVQIVRAGLASEGVVDAATGALAVAPDPEDELKAEARLSDSRRFTVQLAHTEVAFFGSCTDLARGRTSRTRRLVYAGAVPWT